MTDVVASDGKDHVLGDIGRVIAHALDVLGDEVQVHAPGDVARVFHHIGQEGAEQGVVHLVDIGIGRLVAHNLQQAQELVSNLLRHSGAAEVHILLRVASERVLFQMEDNGKGFDIEEAKRKGGIGLKNMQLRTEYLKGKLEIDSSPKNGTTIIIEIPLS